VLLLLADKGVLAGSYAVALYNSGSVTTNATINLEFAGIEPGIQVQFCHSLCLYVVKPVCHELCVLGVTSRSVGAR